MQLENIINIEYECNIPCSLEKLRIVQKVNKFIIPSDLLFLLLNSDGLILKVGYEISLDKANKICEIGNILELDWIEREFQYDLKRDGILNYTSEYLKIALTFSQDFVLIGNSINNINEIFLYSYDDDEIIKICDSLFDFLNYHLL